MSTTGLRGRELRARFAAGSRGSTVDGRFVAWESLSVRSMNFGQHWRGSGVVGCRYSLELSLQFFREFLAQPDVLPDLIADTRQHPDPAELLDQALIAAGFPSADQALHH